LLSINDSTWPTTTPPAVTAALAARDTQTPIPTTTILHPAAAVTIPAENLSSKTVLTAQAAADHHAQTPKCVFVPPPAKTQTAATAPVAISGPLAARRTWNAKTALTSAISANAAMGTCLTKARH
jgi:hypothetical protein